MYSQCIISINKQLISETDTFLSLSRWDLKAETVQDQALQTKYHAKNTANRNRQQMQIMPKILRDNRTFYTSVPNIVKRKICKET